jgi:GH15 family glucan-1,4-alpha-glucosidase
VECITGTRGDKFASILRSREQLHTCGISSFTVGKTAYRGLEGTWRDAEDGELTRNPIEQGSVDSTVSIHANVGTDKPTEVTLWLCAAKSLDEVLSLQQTVLTETPDRLHRNSHNYWKSWVNKNQMDFGSLSPKLVDLYKRSLLITRTHIDRQGGIVAAADSDIMAFNRDTYTYVWPRDGAFVSLAMDRAGYQEVTRSFFHFCARVQQQDGYLLHKYNPDGSVGSSWHPWMKNGEAQLPIQEDETALVIYALYKHFQSVNDFEFLQEMYEKFVKRAASFLCEFREEKTGLPLPSYDPWEEHRGVFTYTTATTIAGLHAAAEICHILGHHNHSEIYQNAADEMRQALLFHLYDEKLGRFLKKIDRKNGETVGRDETPDASIMAIWKLGVLPADDPRVVSTMQQLHDLLTVRTNVGGMARYTTDYYQSVTPPTRDIA